MELHESWCTSSSNLSFAIHKILGKSRMSSSNLGFAIHKNLRISSILSSIMRKILGASIHEILGVSSIWSWDLARQNGPCCSAAMWKEQLLQKSVIGHLWSPEKLTNDSGHIFRGGEFGVMHMVTHMMLADCRAGVHWKGERVHQKGEIVCESLSTCRCKCTDVWFKGRAVEMGVILCKSRLVLNHH